MMMATIEGNRFKIVNSRGEIVRQFSCREPVQNVQVNGDEVYVLFTSGRGALYNINGALMRYLSK